MRLLQPFAVYLGNILRMCKERGYTNIQYVPHDSDLFTKYLLYIKCDQSVVLCAIDHKINIDFIKKYIELMPKIKHERLIIVHGHNITPSVKKIIQLTDFIKFEVFHIHEFGFVLIDHKFVPQHSKVVPSTDEYKEIKALNLLNKIDKILDSDVICRYYNFQTGDLIRIQGDDYVNYRMVTTSDG